MCKVYESEMNAHIITLEQSLLRQSIVCKLFLYAKFEEKSEFIKEEKSNRLIRTKCLKTAIHP